MKNELLYDELKYEFNKFEYKEINQDSLIVVKWKDKRSIQKEFISGTLIEDSENYINISY